MFEDLLINLFSYWFRIPKNKIIVTSAAVIVCFYEHMSKEDINSVLKKVMRKPVFYMHKEHYFDGTCALLVEFDIDDIFG